MNDNPDRLFDLLPVIHRQRDAEQGYPLRALLRVIAEQVALVESDIEQLYANWFIETAEEWAVTYIADLIGYRSVHEAGEPGDVTTAQSVARNRILVPRREVANTIRYRRRRGTIALLEELARDVAGWPARAVEFYRLLGVHQSLNHLRHDRGQLLDLRDAEGLAAAGGTFNGVAHSAEVRRVGSPRTRGRHSSIPGVGLYIWRLKALPVTQSPAFLAEAAGPHCYTFSVLGNDTPLFTRPQAEATPSDIAGPLNVPAPVSRLALERHLDSYCGPGKSLNLWLGTPRVAVPPERIVVADLSGWHYRPRTGQIAVDPELGRIAFPPRDLPKKGVSVSYHYGFSAELGGGEYDRPLVELSAARLYRVGEGEEMTRLGDALRRWREEQPERAVIEITDSGVYVEPVRVELAEGQELVLRAANRTRPVLRLLDWQTSFPDSLSVVGAAESRFALDGLLVAGRGMQVEGPLAQLRLHHSTLVPGWMIGPDCTPQRPAEPSLELIDTNARVCILSSILGSIQVNRDEVQTEPIRIELNDSILDATSAEREALGAPGWPRAHATLAVRDSTVIGQVLAHAIELADNTIFMGRVNVARRQVGCVRFSYVPPDSRTPRRYRCQPDGVLDAIAEQVRAGEIDPAERGALEARERLRVRPQFNSLRYGTPTYGQLAFASAGEIRRGADDESEMGAFHDLFQPQRESNLKARLAEYTPAGMDGGLIFVS